MCSDLVTGVAVIGEGIRQARLAKGLTLDDLAEATKIRALVIDSMENNDFSPCGGRVYARGQIRGLAVYLGIDPEIWLEQFDSLFPNVE
jgi:cytoskeleton protein RodZ